MPSLASPDTPPPYFPQPEIESPRKKKLRRLLFQERLKNKIKTRKIRVLGQSLKRYKKKVISLQQIISELEKNNFIKNEEALLLKNMNTITKEMLERKKSRKRKYSLELRKFAITLNFFSPKAYDYVRTKFDTCLPHSSTIGKWLQTIDASPGFTSESFKTLEKHVQYSEKTVLCSLIIDEMSIRKHLEWDGTTFHGYVNCGVNINDDNNELAKEVFVLLVTCINGTWKLPVAYFLTNGLSGEQKCSVVKQGIMLVENTGVKIVSLTCDGAPSNLTMSTLLGCSFHFPTINTKFVVNGSLVNKYFFLDPCHMTKLVRNAFGEKRILKDMEGNSIDWKYIENLHKLQENEGLHLGNKLRRAHMNFFKQKMKVRLATQLLSESVASALEYCEEKLCLDDFKGCKATVNFLRIMNNIFDILNSRTLVAPGFKKPLCKRNILQVTEFINFAIGYISKLTLADDKLLIIHSQRKTGFIGLIVSLNSALQLYRELVTEQKLIIYFPLYKISQDHIELFFCSIRSKGGWNNNPTARQFMGAYKRLLVRGEVREGGVGNCIPLEQISVLVASSRIKHKPEEHINSSLPGFSSDDLLDATDNICELWQDHDYLINEITMTQCSSQIVIYIAGFVSNSLKKGLKCETCIAALLGDRDNFLHSLITKKTCGGLVYPSEDVIFICNKAERYIRVYIDKIHEKNYVLMLGNKIIAECIRFKLFKQLEEHVLEYSTNHIYFLIKSILTKYINVRLHFITKIRSQKLDSIRSQFTKLILFRGQ